MHRIKAAIGFQINREDKMLRVVISIALLSASTANAASAFDGVWGIDGKALIEIRGGTVKSLNAPSEDASVCVARYIGAQELGDVLEASFEYICGDGSSGGVGTTTYMLDSGSLTELTCDGMKGAPKDQMRCFDPSVMTRIE